MQLDVCFWDSIVIVEMIFFDETNPNKYAKLKKALVPYDLYDEESAFFFKKKRFGSGDGGYVLAWSESYKDKSISLLSYGIGGDPEGVGFEHEFSKLGAKLNLYDGAIEVCPIFIENAIFRQENLTKWNFKDHVAKLPKSEINILKLDIEGSEYQWLTKENLELCFETFDQIVIEVHGLIEEVPDGWVIEPAIQEAKNHLFMKEEFFRKLNDRFYLFHIHGNNHAPRFVDFPDSLELTYVNKKRADQYGICKTWCPDKNVDEPNYKERPDFVLNFWI